MKDKTSYSSLDAKEIFSKMGPIYMSTKGCGTGTCTISAQNKILESEERYSAEMSIKGFMPVNKAA